jgi:ketosteroid isomerase-like protein
MCERQPWEYDGGYGRARFERVEDIFEDGDVAILEWSGPLELRCCGFFHVRNGKIAFQRGYWDKLSFLTLHGLPIG